MIHKSKTLMSKGAEDRIQVSQKHTPRADAAHASNGIRENP
jgi:hypothetical protein